MAVLVWWNGESFCFEVVREKTAEVGSAALAAGIAELLTTGRLWVAKEDTSGGQSKL